MKIEIKNAPSSEIDWSKFNQLVKGVNSEIVVLTTDISFKTGAKIISTENFSGFDIYNMSYSDSWLKSGFEPFNGEITLKND